jgi:hypothetical protein
MTTIDTIKLDPNGNLIPEPIRYDDNPTVGYVLTKREYFAALAMQGILTKNNSTKEVIAEMAVEHADALIKALNKEK